MVNQFKRRELDNLLFTEKEEEIFLSILPDFMDIIDSKTSGNYTLKEKTDAWFKITVLFRKKTGIPRSVKNLRAKYLRIRKKLKKVVSGLKNADNSTSIQIMSTEGGLKNELDRNHSAIVETYDPELVTVEEALMLMPMESQEVTLEQKDPLQLSTEEAELTIVENDPLRLPTKTTQVTVLENDPLQLPAETSQVDPLDISHLKPEDHLKINSLLRKKQASREAKDTFCQPKTKNQTLKKNQLQKGMLEIEEARNEREKIMLQIEVERNEREKRLLCIEEERNKREKRMLCIEKERNEQEKKLLQLKAEKNKQNETILRLEAERNELERRILLLNAERNNHNYP